jgi:hypothetical protein
MATTTVRGGQITNATIQRQDLDTSTVGQAVVAKILQGTNVTLSSTGGDSGTGDVTISVPTGGQGPAGVNACNITSGPFTVPAVGSTVTVTLNDASWVVVGQMVYVDQAGGGPGQSGALQVQAKTGNQLTLLNPQSPPGIPPADNTQAGLLKLLSGNATDYVGGDNASHPIAALSAFVTKTAAYTLVPADSGKYVIASGGSWTLTLPAPVAGFNFRLRNDMGISGTTGTITIQANGGTIDGS